MNPYKPGEIEVPQNLKVQYKSWVVQKIAWIIMVIIIIAGALGLFGQGIFSYREVVSTNGTMQLKYERFLRYEAENELVLTFKPDNDEDTLAINLNNNYLDNIKVESIQPTPLYSSINKNFTRYIFRTETTKSLRFTFYINPLKVGTVPGSIIFNNDTLNFTHFIYP